MKKIIIEIDERTPINISEELLNEINDLIIEKYDDVDVSITVEKCLSHSYEHFIDWNKYYYSDWRVRNSSYDYVVIYSPSYGWTYKGDRLDGDVVLEILYIHSFFLKHHFYLGFWVNSSKLYKEIKDNTKASTDFLKLCERFGFEDNIDTVEHFIYVKNDLDTFTSDDEYGFTISNYDWYESYNLH